MKPKHTPGPWTLHSNMSNGYLEINIGPYDGSWVAKLYGEDTEKAINGALIAAAPEMLDIIGKFLEVFDTDFDDGDDFHEAMIEVRKKAIRTIKKARGES